MPATVIAAALPPSNVPWLSFCQAREENRLALSEAVAAEIREVLARPKCAGVLTPTWRAGITALLFGEASWFARVKLVTDCRKTVLADTRRFTVLH
jgi:hypothetical protein